MEWFKNIVVWIQSNWGIIQTVLIIVIGLFALWRVKFAGDLLKMGLYVLTALIGLSQEGITGITREDTDVVAARIYERMKAAGLAGMVSLEQVQAATWKLWSLFKSALMLPGAEDGDNQFKPFLQGYAAARQELALRGRLSASKTATKLFGHIR